MRIKLIVLATAVAAIALGASVSTAALQSGTDVVVKLKKAGAPATAVITINNTDTAGIVPEPITNVTIKSAVAKFNGKAITQCKTPVPTGAANNGGKINPACPSKSKVGSGSFIVNTGKVGQPLPSEFGTIDGKINIYNYKPSGGGNAALLMEVLSQTPVPNTHVYVVATIKGGTITARVPKMEDLPPAVIEILSPPSQPQNARVVSLAKITTSIKPPKSKKPFFTLKNTKNLSFSVTLDR
jgi:hypothetical protein